MGDDDDPTDEALLRLAAGDGEAFGVFYDRHHVAILAALRHRLGDVELALDLTAEVFAVALERCESFTPRGAGSARAWLRTIAHNKLVDLYRNGAAADRARRALQMQPLVVTDEQLDQLERRLASEGSGALQALADLPPEERAAVIARVVDEAGYDAIAHDLAVSESVVRQRVSRGLRRMRATLEETR